MKKIYQAIFLICIAYICVLLSGYFLSEIIRPFSEEIASLLLGCFAVLTPLAGTIIRLRLLPLRKTIQYKSDWQRLGVNIFFVGIAVEIVFAVIILFSLF